VTTPERPIGGPGSLFIFDGYNFLFRAYHAIPMLNAPDGTPTNAVQGFARMVQAARRDFQPARLVAVFDAGGDGGRKATFPGYKAKRPPPPEDLLPQFSLVRDATDALGIVRVEDPRFEADDIIASYAVCARERGIAVTIISSDKDLMQLCTDEAPPIVLYDTMKDIVLGPREIEEKFGVPPRLLGDLLALTGDSSDNIPGVPGIGVKTAAQLIAEFGSLEGVLAGAPSIKQAKRRERLVEHAEAARLSRRLVELHSDIDLPVGLEELQDKGFDEQRLLEFFEPLGFKLLLREIGATGRARRDAAPTGGAAPAADGDPGAVELLRAPGFVRDPSSDRVLMEGDEAALHELVAALAQVETIGLFVATDAHGRDATEATLGADVAGIAFAAPGMPPAYVPFGHRQIDLDFDHALPGLGGRKQLPRDVVMAALQPLLENASLGKGIYDAKATTHALDNLGVTLRGVTDDPMIASYTLDPARMSHALEVLAHDVLGYACSGTDLLTGRGRKFLSIPECSPAAVGPWACERAAVTLALQSALRDQVAGASKGIPALLRDVEMPLLHVLYRIERRGIEVDVEELHRQSEELGVTLRVTIAGIQEAAGHAINIDSPQQLQKLLFEEWGLPPTRKIKTGYTTDANALEQLALFDPRVKLILEYRTLSKLKNTYLDALPRLVRPQTKRLHTSFNQVIAATGRLSSTDPNLQNIPIRTPEGRRIREAFVASQGRELVALDYSQIELRILAHLSGDPNLMSAFIEGVDVHRRTAAEVFDIPESFVDDEQRRIAKAVNFGVVYGQTAHGLAQQLGIPRGKAGSYIRAYFERIPGVDKYMRELIAVAGTRGFSETILGRRRRIPELERKGPARNRGERMARNTPIQGSAADILKVAMIAVDRALEGIDWAQMLLTVHDELIFECDVDRVDELIALCRPLMESAVELSVPLQVDAGHGRTWAACKG
jgi:DNA polymerase-1